MTDKIIQENPDGKKYSSKFNPDDPDTPPRMIFNYISKENATILDVGCACGDLGILLKNEKNAEMYGLEYNPKSVELCLATGAYKEVLQVDLDTLTTKDFPEYQKKFDYIICADILEHLRDPENVLKILKNYLKEDGFILASIPNVAHISVKATYY